MREEKTTLNPRGRIVLDHHLFTREPTGRIELQPRDLEVLLTAYEYRFADSRMLRIRTGHTGSDWAFQSRLLRLYREAYLDRPLRQVALRALGEVRHLIYALGRNGAKVLAERFGEPLDHRRWTQKNEAGDLYIQHTLGVNTVRTCLHAAWP